MEVTEINRKLAEGVMGWKQDVDEEGEVFYFDNNDPPQLPFIIYGWNPFELIAHAFEVVEKMTLLEEKGGLGWRLHLFVSEDKCSAIFYKRFVQWREFKGRDYTHAPTPSAAISLAALEAWEKREER